MQHERSVPGLQDDGIVKDLSGSIKRLEKQTWQVVRTTMTVRVRKRQQNETQIVDSSFGPFRLYHLVSCFHLSGCLAAPSGSSPLVSQPSLTSHLLIDHYVLHSRQPSFSPTLARVQLYFKRVFVISMSLIRVFQTSNLFTLTHTHRQASVEYNDAWTQAIRKFETWNFNNLNSLTNLI